MNRAYSILEIKAVDEEKRVIEGVATTPAPDRAGDIVEPLGAKFQLPMPLLWQHDSKQPVGHVTFAKPNKTGIPFRAKIEKTTEPGTLKDRLDEAWQSVKLKLVQAVSIGFTINAYEILKDGGWRINEWEWLELSLVTIPMNAEATITTIKSIDAELLAATGHKQNGSERTVAAGASATRSTRVVKAQEAKPMTTKSRAEQISAYEATRQTKAARMDAIMDESAEKGETLDAAGKEEYDTLESEVKEIDEHLKRMRAAETRAIATATAVNGKSIDDASASRGSTPAFSVQVRPNVEKGTGFARAVWCKVHAGIHHQSPAEVAKAQPWHNQTPEVERYLKTAVAAGTTTDNAWAGYLVEEMLLASEFAELLRPATIIGRIPGITRVPFNVKINREITAASVGWVGELGVKPVSAMAFDQITLLFNKVAGIVPVSEELFRFSTPAIDAIIRRSLIDSISYLIDRDFLDPTKAAVTGVSPASVTNGVTPITATGTSADALRADLGSLIAAYNALNLSIGSLVLVMTSTQAMRIAFMRNTLGQAEFQGLTPNGGTLEGIPVIVSENIVATGGSPVDGGLIVAINAREILLADDGGVNVDMSREASLQMDTAPDSPATASTVMVSLWQKNMVALKAERFITWAKRRTGAVQFIQNAKYA
jgi:HK97 family phage major capsid protein/HK97 family phage prohead protease